MRSIKYVRGSQFSFSKALVLLKKGEVLRRTPWRSHKVIYMEEAEGCNPFFTEYNHAKNVYSVGWLPNSMDLFATDWQTAPKDRDPRVEEEEQEEEEQEEEAEEE